MHLLIKHTYYVPGKDTVKGIQQGPCPQMDHRLVKAATCKQILITIGQQCNRVERSYRSPQRMG